MVNCPILSKEIDNDDCKNTIEASKYIVDNSVVLKRIKRINGWTFICKNCPHHAKYVKD